MNIFEIDWGNPLVLFPILFCFCVVMAFFAPVIETAFYTALGILNKLGKVFGFIIGVLGFGFLFIGCFYFLITTLF